MKKSILGEYDFSNVTAINFMDNGEEEINATILHETIHMLLTKQTVWGMFCYLIRKVVIYDNNYKHMLDEFCTHSRKVQEAAAVFVECIYIIRNKGYKCYFDYLQYLKKNNKEYYKYIYPLIKFLKYLEPESSVHINIDELYFLIITLAKISLNANITEIDIEVFKQKKKFKKFISDIENVEKYIPNKRLNKLLNKYYNIIDKSGALNLEVLELELKQDMGDNYFINDEIMYKIKEYLKQIYKNSHRIDEISTYFDTVKLIEIDIKDLPNYSFPHSFSTFSSDTSNDDEIFNYCRERLGILFYLGNVCDIDLFDSRLLYIPKESMKIMKSMLGEKSYVTSYFDYMKKKILFLNTDQLQTRQLIEVSESPIVVNYMAYDIERDDIKGIDTNNKEIYLYCDRTYPHSKDLINSIAREKCKVRIIEYKNMYLLVVKVSEKTKFILPFMGIAYSQVRSDIVNSVLNVELADNPDGVTETDDYILKTPESIQVYDLIVNCLFQLE
ncbi:hypothetical protein [Clostridium botulinum]|uniref:Uncharacterized protein n=1 Tax=Clostridium botulinum TaxID=1491 RepID=A0A0M1M2E8_CLOBO|nr:hypothetical protein [Clostridium botulinum]KOR64108.1 hypothetical protein ADT22_01685 [Clostridium botulinum]MCS6112546.1 hypothetical protein [Clostridium botulinum]NFF88715.1 hypothetical protein [Clostridium botulinum]NFG11211.1 hypothetical protein [Clostridium botulinum]NFL43403.1 hypothetical protein [Clostridium botulinum]